MSVTAVVGGQFGSEGKGAVVAHLARQHRHHVRVGAANAGHTLYTHRGDIREKHVMQQLPCAAYANPDAELYIGPGAQITDGILRAELERLQVWRHEQGLGPKTVCIDPRAHVITQEQVEREAATDLAERIGSTSTIAREGIGMAQADRVMRSPECVLAGEVYDDADWAELVDVPVELDLRRRESTLLEGTQGTGLSLTTGEFPYVTSRNTTAAGLCADAGVAPGRLDRVVVVLRTYPIRVAGNSGPFAPGSTEIGWGDLDIDPESERTTVTKRVRRVATFSMQQAMQACLLNGATEIALMFVDYLEPFLAGANGSWDKYTVGSSKLREMIEEIEFYTGVPVTMLGTGPDTMIRRSASLRAGATI